MSHNELWAHLYDAHDHTPQDEQDAELDHAAMHRPGSIFGSPDHAHTCQWFAACTNPATHTQSHPILGEVPICDRCQAKYDA